MRATKSSARPAASARRAPQRQAAEGADGGGRRLRPAETRSPVTGWSIAATLAVIAVIVYAIRYALLPFVFAVAIAFVVEPLVVRVQRAIGGRRWLAAALVYIAVLAVFAALAYWIGITAGADLVQFAQRAPALMQELIAHVTGSGISLFGTTYTPQQIVGDVGQALAGALGIGAAMRAAGFGMAAVLGGFLTLVLVPYMMISGPRLSAGAVWLIPPERRHSVEVLLPKILPALRRYLVGVLAVITYTATVAWVGFGPVFGLPHAPLLALTVGVLEMVPVAGPIASGLLVAMAALNQQSLAGIAALIGFAIGLRLTIDNIVGPIVLGQAARLHPVVVIFAFVSGAMLFGVVGLLLAVPVGVCIKLALQHYYSEPIRPPVAGE